MSTIDRIPRSSRDPTPSAQVSERPHWRVCICAAAVTLVTLISACGGSESGAAAASAPGATAGYQPPYVPGQFIAKMFTELLGRAPDPEGWQSAVAYFQANACGQPTLKSWALTVVNSAEYQDLEYDSVAYALSLYRGILNREPASGEFTAAVSALDSGTTVATLAEQFLSSSEFGTLESQICQGKSYSFGSQGTGLAIRVPTSGSDGYDNLSETELQALLDAAAAGSSILLKQKTVIYLSSPLLIPSGVTLSTYGAPPPSRHALMARLVRQSAFAAPMVELAANTTSDSGALTNIWVDGQRAANSVYTQLAINIEIYGGDGVVVDSNFVANSGSSEI
jgi:hypothetical protein